MGKRIKRILKSKSGESIIFVLGVMLILLFIGGSVLVAASAAAGSGASRQVRAQLELYADSIQRVIKHSLDNCGDDLEANFLADFTSYTAPQTLGGQLLRYMHRQASETSLVATKSSITDVQFPSTALSEGYSATITSIELDWSVLLVDGIYAAEPSYEYSNVGGTWTLIPVVTPDTPHSAKIDARVTITVEVAHVNRTVTSVATYNYSGGFLKNPEDTTNPGQYDASILKIETAGDWTLISYEKS